MLSSRLPRGINLTRLTISLSLLFGLSSTVAVAASQSVVSVPGTARWVDTKVDVIAGQLLAITGTGLWIEGNTTNGPEGVAKPWPDNFFNFADLGVCMYCAKTATPFWGALIGYVGSSPPTAGSYTSAAVFREATKVFYVGKSYEASAPASGRLWLNKNTDAYSNYTVDNGGHVEATIKVSPPETEILYHARMRKSAASIKTLEPLQRARNYCVRAVFDHWQDVAVKQMLKLELCGADQVCLKTFDISDFAGTIKDDILQIRSEASNGRVMNATWDFGRSAYKVIGLFPGKESELFGILGPPALDCTMAGFWYTGKLGGQIGQLLRKFLLPDASIAGIWTFTRSASIDCTNFSKGCLTIPIHIVVDSCNSTGTQCAISRSDGDWQSAHTITRSGATWSAEFDDVGITCTDKQNIDHPNIARIGLSFSVTTAEDNKAKSAGGFYTVQAASNPPDCAGNVRAGWLLYGSR